MKKLKCGTCGLIKNETEFYYNFLNKKYIKNKCKNCDNYNKYFNNIVGVFDNEKKG